MWAGFFRAGRKMTREHVTNNDAPEACRVVNIQYTNVYTQTRYKPFRTCEKFALYTLSKKSASILFGLYRPWVWIFRWRLLGVFCRSKNRPLCSKMCDLKKKWFDYIVVMYWNQKYYIFDSLFQKWNELFITHQICKLNLWSFERRHYSTYIK